MRKPSLQKSSIPQKIPPDDSIYSFLKARYSLNNLFFFFIITAKDGKLIVEPPKKMFILIKVLDKNIFLVSLTLLFMIISFRFISL